MGTNKHGLAIKVYMYIIGGNCKLISYYTYLHKGESLHPKASAKCLRQDSRRIRNGLGLLLANSTSASSEDRFQRRINDILHRKHGTQTLDSETDEKEERPEEGEQRTKQGIQTPRSKAEEDNGTLLLLLLFILLPSAWN